MKKTYLYSRMMLVALLMVSVLFSCEERPDNPSQGEMTFRLTMGEVSHSSLAFEIVPSADNEDFFAGVYSSEEVHGKKGDVLFAYIAGTDQFSRSIYRGTQRLEVEELKSSTVYHVVYFGFNTAEQSRTTEIFVSDPVSTLESPSRFDLKVTDITRTSARFIYTPKVPGTYMSGLLEWNVFEDEYESDPDLVREQDLSWYEYLAENYGGEWTEYLSQDIREGVYEVGADELGWLLKWDTEYMIYAFGLNQDGTVTSDVEYFRFKTLPREIRDLTFDIRINEIFHNGIDATITPSNDADSYFVSLQRASYVDWWTNPENGVTVDDMMYELVEGRFLENDLDSYIFTGDFHLTPEDYSLSRDDADSYLIVFGYADGPTTDPVLIPFHTLPSD